LGLSGGGGLNPVRRSGGGGFGKDCATMGVGGEKGGVEVRGGGVRGEEGEAARLGTGRRRRRPWEGGKWRVEGEVCGWEGRLRGGLGGKGGGSGRVRKWEVGGRRV